MLKLVHFYPDRDCRQKNEWADNEYWNFYKKAAYETGIEWILAAHDAIDILCDGNDYKIQLDGLPVTSRDTFFNTDIYGLPHQHMDTWQQLTTFFLLEHLGFYLTIPPYLSCIANDKLLTYKFFMSNGLNFLPSARITTGRKLEYKDIDPLVSSIGFPMIVKPASWGAGMGVVIARDFPQLKGILSLAAAADVTMVLQPFLDSKTIIDYRVYVIDGKAHTVMARKARAGNVLANISQGGTSTIEDLPPGLEKHVEVVAQKITIPYFCADFLYDGRTFWFSEIELDGGIPEDPERSMKILIDRFSSYKKAFRDHLKKFD